MPDANQPTVIVLFGVSGDLAGRKVLPALYHLVKDGLLPDKIRVIGTSRQELTKAKLLKNIELCVLEEDKVCDPAVLKKFNNIFEVLKFDPVDESDYLKLKEELDKIESAEGCCFNRLFYLSIPPQVYSPIVRLLGSSGLARGCSHKVGKSRLLIEKPFGYDLKSAKDLIKQTGKYFKENQIYRIDHYLAKETAQNILAFRRHNPLFNDIWDNSLISKIHIRALETIGIEGRANFYDNMGALRDIIQSHLIQLMAITTMDLPNDITSSDEIHAEKIKLLNKTRLEKLNNASLIRGQYETYKKEVANPKSATETYVRLCLNVANKRWAGVPMVLETGKSLYTKTTDLIIDFSRPADRDCNQLTIRIQPDEGIDIKLFVKKPGFDNVMQSANMDFSYLTAFRNQAHPDAYERVIVDAIRGDQSLFASSKEVIRSWEILQPILSRWQNNSDDLVIYPNGSEGPSNRNLLN
jgi:glucose-6-phosphate 1-dehydrogenase